MLSRLYTSVALFILPSVEDALKSFEQTVNKLDTVTLHLERRLEDHAVALANNSRSRRIANEALVDRFSTVLAHIVVAGHKIIQTVEAAYNRREARVIEDINALRSHLDRASEARDAVASFLERASK